MIDHILTDKEMQLVLEILQAESRKLAGQTRHCDVLAAKRELRSRLRTVDRIVERFQEVQAGDYST